MNPAQLSHELRKGVSDDLTRRRWIVGLSMVGATMAQLVTLYQVGVIKHLPDPPIPIFDSSKVDASNYAYKRFNSPDGPLMLLTYGLTAWLASAGGQNRAQEMPLLALATSAKTIFDAVSTVKLAGEEWGENQALCAYCQVATVCSWASAILSLPEAWEAIQTMREQGVLETVNS
ncbi:MAG: vitamin K epoxide reductase family protein [Chloroflexaceae bacterium]|jgi:uncharacterized membrane protein|nr:vitamin K epoxide reductase family protein [Chloroflexaceae bacterium]